MRENSEAPELLPLAGAFTGGLGALSLRLRLAALMAHLGRELPATSPLLSPPPTAPSCSRCGAALKQIQLEACAHWRCPRCNPDLPDKLSDSQSDVLEHALRLSIRTLRGRIRMRQRLARGFAERGQLGLSENFASQAEAARTEEGLICQVLGRVLELRRQIR